jgi:hypothetical protein
MLVGLIFEDIEIEVGEVMFAARSYALFSDVLTVEHCEFHLLFLLPPLPKEKNCQQEQ